MAGSTRGSNPGGDRHRTRLRARTSPAAVAEQVEAEADRFRRLVEHDALVAYLQARYRRAALLNPTRWLRVSTYRRIDPR